MRARKPFLPILAALAAALGAASLHACASDTGTLIVHWQPMDSMMNPLPCNPGDKVTVQIGAHSQVFSCDAGGPGKDASGNPYVGGGQMDGIAVGAPYDLFLQLNDGKTGYIVAQAVLPAGCPPAGCTAPWVMGHIQADTPLDVGTIPLVEPAQSSPFAGLDAGGD